MRVALRQIDPTVVARSFARLRSLGPAALLLYAATLFAWIQFSTPHLVDRDGYFHARYAALLPERGLARDFPAASASVLRDRFSDKEFLFHVFLAPFVAVDPVTGTKIAVVALDVAIVATAWLALRAIDARWPALFAALLLAAGNHFLFRLQMARPHLLAVLLAIAGTAAILTGRRRLVFALGFIWAWAYAAPHLLIGLALLATAAPAVSGERSEIGAAARTALAAAGGVVTGLVVHPYFPNDLMLFWIQNVTVLAQAFGLASDMNVRLGAEFDPVTTRSMLVTSAGALASYIGGAAAAIAARDRPSRTTVALFFMASGCFALFLLSAKFVEYFAPLSVLFLASALTEAQKGRPVALPAAALSIVAAALLHAVCAGYTHAAVRRTPPPALEGAARWIATNALPGDVVAHLSWADFSVLFFNIRDRHLLNGMDPMFLAVRDPEGARLLEDMRAGRRPIDGAALARRFGARWLAVNKEREGPYEAAVFAGLDLAYEDDRAAVFRLPE